MYETKYLREYLYVCGLVLIMALLFSFAIWFQIHTVEHIFLTPSQKKQGRELVLPFFIFSNVSTSQKLGFCSLWMFALARDFEEQ